MTSNEILAPRPWWETRWFVAAMILLAFVPMLYPAVPPLVDVPGHMARYRVELDLAHSPELQRFFAFKWQLIGNLGVDLLVIPMSKVFGLELSVKLVALLIPPMTVAGFLWVAREVHHRIPPTAAFALPFAFNHPYLWGFLNYALAMALAFLAFGLWLRLGRLEKTRLRALLFVPISFLLFVCHVFGWGTLGLLAFSAEAVRQHDRGATWWKAGFRAVPHALALAGPVLLILLWRSGVGEGRIVDWFNWSSKWKWLTMSLRDQFIYIDGIMVGLSLLVVVAAIFDRRLTLSRNLAFSALVLLACFLLLPRVIFGSNYADMRLIPYIIATFLLSIRYKPTASMVGAGILAVSAVCFYVFKVVLTTYTLGTSWSVMKQDLQVLENLPRGAALVTLIGEPCGDSWPLNRKSHLAGISTVRYNSFTNDQWAIAGANLLTVTYRQAGRFANDPSQMVRRNGCGNRERMEIDFALRAIPRDAFSHIWLVDVPPHDPQNLSGYRLQSQVGQSQLYVREGNAALSNGQSKQSTNIAGAARP